MSTYNSPTDVVAGSLAKSSDLNNLDAAVAAAFALIPPEDGLARGTTNYAVGTGVANAYLVSLDNPATSYSDGLQVIMKAPYSNTGPSTVNVDSLGIKAIKTEASGDPEAGDITVGVPVELRYSTTTGFFHMIKSSATAASAAAAAAAVVSAAAALVSQNAAAVSASAALVSELAAAGVVSTHAALSTGVHGLAITSGKTLTVSETATLDEAVAMSSKAPKSGATLVSATINAVTPAAAAVGFTIAGGTTPKTLTVDETVAMSDKAPKVSPSFTTPALGTPSSGNLANCTGYPAIPSGTKMLFYADTAPTGWTIDNTLDDKVVYVTKGSAAGGQTGGAVHSAGTWTQPSHTHTGPNHAHTGPSHQHEVSITTSGPSIAGNVQSGAGAGVATELHLHGTVGYTASAAGDTGAAGTGATGDSATVNTWRPAAYSMIICSKN